MTKLPLPAAPPSRTKWVQTERAAHEAWAGLLRSSPRAAELLHLLVANIGDHNAVVVSQDTLATMMGRSKRTVIRAAADLAAANWIEVRQVGKAGTVNAYVINDRVAWSGPRDGLRYSLFSAAVIASSEEQPDDINANLGLLHRVPSLLNGERQLPSGPGLPPPSQPSFEGLEPDLPHQNCREDLDQLDMESFTKPLT